MKLHPRRFRRLTLGTLGAALTLLTACNLPEPQADPVRHFTLSTPGTGKPAENPVSVRTVRLAGHLHSRAMAVRVSDNEVVYLEEVRWAESLDEAITQILRNRLRPISGGAIVSVFVQRCELLRSEHNRVQLEATYTIAVPGTPTRTAAFSASERRWDGQDYGALVGLMRDAVNELGDSIAGTVESR